MFLIRQRYRKEPEKKNRGKFCRGVLCGWVVTGGGKIWTSRLGGKEDPATGCREGGKWSWVLLQEGMETSDSHPSSRRSQVGSLELKEGGQSATSVKAHLEKRDAARGRGIKWGNKKIQYNSVWKMPLQAGGRERKKK